VPPHILRRVASEDKNAPPGNRWDARRGDEYSRLVSRWADRDADTNGVGSKRSDVVLLQGADTATRADARHVAAEGSPERWFMRDSALSLVMFELFAPFLVAQSIGELAVYKV
jgi:hypothetical protein